MRQQHLCAAHAVFTKLRFVDLRQTHLPNSGSRLEFVHFLGPHAPAQSLHAFSDRAAGNHHDFSALPCQYRHLPTPVADSLRVHASALIRDQAGANLDNDPACVFQHVAHDSAGMSPLSKRGSGSSGTTFFSFATWM